MERNLENCEVKIMIKAISPANVIPTSVPSARKDYLNEATKPQPIAKPVTQPQIPSQKNDTFTKQN